MSQSELFADIGRKRAVTVAEIIGRLSHVPFLVSYGAGLNSTALLIGLSERGVRPDLITFADTGGEKPETYDHLARMQTWCASVGFPAIDVVRLHKPIAGDQTLEAERLRLGTLPSRVVGNGTCAMRWKLEPQEKFLKAWGKYQECVARGDKPIRALGFDVDEQSRADVVEDSLCRYAFPLREWGWTREQCGRAIEKAGLPVPLKSACFFCPSSQKHEVIWLAKVHPDLFARAVALERNALESGKLYNVKGLGRHWSWERLVAATDEERKAFIDQPVEPCLACLDGGCDVNDL